MYVFPKGLLLYWNNPDTVEYDVSAILPALCIDGFFHFCVSTVGSHCTCQLLIIIVPLSALQDNCHGLMCKPVVLQLG